MQVVIWCWQ